MLPKSGKLKEISGKKSSEKLDLSEISIKPSILEHNAEVITKERVNDVACYLISVHEDDEIINIWIDSIDYIIHKKEYYNKKSKLYKKITYNTLFNKKNNLKYYREITIENIKKKTKVNILIDTLETKIFQNTDIFNFPLENENQKKK